MLFTQLTFLYLLIITFVLYYIPTFRRWQVQILLLSSFTFYAWSQPILLLLLFTSIGINTYSLYRILRTQSKPKQKVWATAGVVLNLGLLAFFKYTPMFTFMFISRGDHRFGDILLSIPLPIGISFFTFHGISMMIDVYKKKNFESYKYIAQLNLWGLTKITSLYIAFMPQLVSGPIVKSFGFLPQIKTKYLKDIPWELACRQLITGYFLKLVVADNLFGQTMWISYPYFDNYDSVTLLVMIFGYSMQIFADFAGYSLIAIGLAYLFGYQLPINFNFPYISRSFQEFWTRWHISLSSWLREYLYFSLGGSKKGIFRTYLNLMLVMFLGGLWHGGAWSYAIWGSFHGLALVVERLASNITGPLRSKWHAIWQIPLVFTFVMFAWLLFKLPIFEHAVNYVKAIISNKGNRNMVIIFNIMIYSAPVILYHILYLLRQATPGWQIMNYTNTHINGKRVATKLLPLFTYGIMLCIIWVNSGDGVKFIYFQF
ncbi:MAG: MBOAT family O-acyltransferase [Bacteroidota bacterium]|nr:MBOAT family O-acyltransferase [Bacteroidota bacterium]